MGNVFAELKRRHIYRVAAAYAVVAWLLLQIVNNIVPIMQSPAWVGQFCLLLLALGFPLAIFFAWTREVPAADATAPMRATITDMALIGVLLVMIGLLSFQQLVPTRAIVAARQTDLDAAKTAATSPGTAISIAVLPFVNLSSDKEQEFFSDGMTEEITTALAKVPDLRVVARTSAFEFKGKNADIQGIGQQLHATHLIEGSVRKAGNRLRITAQLIKVDDGTHIWAEDYDRELTDVFVIQEDIARTITASLRMPLGLRPGENLVSNRSIDSNSYQQFLLAKAVYRARGLANVQKSIDLLKQVVERNPAYAPGWALLARAYTTLPNYSPALQALTPRLTDLKREVESSRTNSEPAARKAIELDPNLTDGYAALGFIEDRAGKFLIAEEYFLKALALDPNDADALSQYASHLISVGRVKDAIEPIKQAFALEPFIPILTRNYAVRLWISGDDDVVLRILRPLVAQDDLALVAIAMLQAGQGQFNEAADTLASVPRRTPEVQSVLKEAARLLRLAPNKGPISNPPMALGLLDFVYLYTSAPANALQFYERNVDAGWMQNARTPLVWHPSYSPARKTERFKAVMRKGGFVDYWRAKGWPEFCHPTTADDFECG